MRPRRAETLRAAARYAMAIALVGAVTVSALRWSWYWAGHGPLLAFVLAIVIAALVGGARAALLATALSALAMEWFFQSRFGTVVVERARGEGPRGVLLSLGVLVVVIAAVEERRAARRKALGEERCRRAEATEQALRASEGRMRRLWESNIIGVALANAAGAFLDANDFVLRLLGSSREDVAAGRLCWSEITPPEYAPLDVRGIAEAHARGACTPYEKEYVTMDGRRVPVLIGYALLEGSRTDFIVFVLDLTEQKRAEVEVLEHARAAARQEVVLASERAARAEAERASRAKDDFVAMLSHELRTPLHAVVGFARLARRPGQGPEQLGRALDVIERNATLLTQIISDLLDVSSIVTGKISLTLVPVDLGPLLDTALSAVDAAAEARGVALRAHVATPSALVRGDAARLQQVVWNLVTNAIKFTPRGGQVDVSLSAREGAFEIVVSDTGQGMEPAFVPLLFERFRQADTSSSRRHGGLGLGLSIVKHLVELHGGEVRAESGGAGRGSRFTVTLPAYHGGVEETASVAPLDGSLQLAGARVLVVDDERDGQELVRRLLEEQGARVVTASSAGEALAALADRVPDVMVSDIGMPGIDGYELMRQVRGGSAGRDLPAVALTAYARPEDRARALRAGYQAHLAKPVEPRELLTTVARLAHGDAVRPA